MSTKPLREHLIEFYSRRDLRPEVLSRIKSIAQEVSRTGAGGDTRPQAWGAGLPGRAYSPGALAAGACALVLAAFFVFHRWDTPDGRATASAALAQTVADEIARNHSKRLSVDFRATAFDSLQRQLAKLDFSLLEPVRVRERGLRLVGARYCSIQGRPAAQIRLKDGAGRSFTLYESPATPVFAVIPEMRADISGVSVELWQESGLLMGLAGPPGAGSPRLQRRTQ